MTARAGDRLPYVPRQTLTADKGYTRALTGSAGFDAQVDAAYRSNVTTQIDQAVLGYRRLGGFTSVDASMGISLASSWHLRIFVDNLTNVLGVTSAGSLYRSYDDPRYRIENVARPMNSSE